MLPFSPRSIPALASGSNHRAFFRQTALRAIAFGGFLGCFGSRAAANGLMAVIEDFRLVNVSPQLQLNGDATTLLPRVARGSVGE